jgi:hypothetical protein
MGVFLTILIVLASLILLLILLLFLRVGATVIFNDGGMSVFARVGPVVFKVFPSEKEKKPKKKPKKPSDKVSKYIKSLIMGDDETPGKFKQFLELLAKVKKTLGRLRRKLLIKNLTLHYVAADKDPVKAALSYGNANAIYGVVRPLLESIFNIKKIDFSASADFEADEPMIYAKATITIAIWQVLYVVSAILSKPKQTKLGEDEQNNGKEGDK